MKKIIRYKSRWLVCMVACLIGLLAGCKKFIEVDPPVTSVTGGSVFLEDATAAAALTSIYSQLTDAGLALNITLYPELAADNLRLYSNNTTDYNTYYTNSLLPGDPSTIPNFWTSLYPFIYQANGAIEGLTKSNALTPAVKQNLLGEAYFLRAFFYYYLASMYGDVPLATSTDYLVNNKLTRTAADNIYTQAVVDLKTAHELLSDGYLQSDASTAYPSSTAERVRPNKSACSALLARIYLSQKDYSNAEISASEVINKAGQFTLIPLDQVFLKNSKETIWSLQSVGSNINTREGDLFILPSGGPGDARDQVIYLSPKFVQSFQTGDQRRVKWTAAVTKDNISYDYAYKYKIDGGVSAVTEYTIVLRLAEQYLIRAEARIQQNKVAEGIADLNFLRDRAIDKSQPDESLRLKLLTSSLSKEDAIAALIYERRVELFCEWSHRWFDLKRTGRLDAVMTTATPEKGGIWQSYKALFPVPAREIQFNGALSQNPGYTK